MLSMGHDPVRDDVEAIALAAGRRVGTDGHRHASAHLQGRLRELGLRPYRGDGFALPYRHSMAPRVEFQNLAGVLPGRDRRLPPMLVGAHYDSIIDAPCAGDNAVAVGIALATAQALAAAPHERDVVVALFDAEEPPYYLGAAMGSIRFCADQADERGFHAAVIMDLVGHEFALPLPGLGNLLVATGIESSATLPALLDACPRSSDLPLVVTQNYVVGDMSDHHAFRLQETPYLFLTSGRWADYHQPTDTPDKLAWGKIGLVRDYVAGLVGRLAETERLAPAAADTTALEIRYLEAALGPALPAVTARLGLGALRTRDDLERFAWGLQALGV